MAWAGIAVYLLLIAPVALEVRAELAGESSRCVFAVRVWGVGVQGMLYPGRDAAGRLRLFSSLAGRPGRESGGHGGAAWRFIRALARADKARALLRRGVSLRRARIAGQIGGEDAALTALLTGLLGALCACVPALTGRLSPAFHGKTCVRLGCIAFSRLGILLAACALGAVSFLRAGKKEDTPWSIPSET